ncbi:helix-turn-helix domain-containing protein [Halomonas sp. H5]|uniref:helix-turn-helix domain-containing protein n=1 Tax=Halomonas sp. H5 TaxID=3423910 RepID=UPI003D36F95C
MDSIGARLRAERDRLGMTQTELGEAAGVTKNTQRLYETDQRSPKADYLVALDAMGVDTHYVLTGRRVDAGQQAASAEGIPGESAAGEIDVDYLAEIAEMLDGVARQAGKRPPSGAAYVRMVAEVYNFMAQEGSRDSETTGRLLRLVVNR